VSAALYVQTDAAGAAPEVEHPTANQPYRAPFLRPPRPERCNVVGRIAREHASVVAFDHLGDVPPREQVGEQLAEGVLRRGQRRAQQRARA